MSNLPNVTLTIGQLNNGHMCLVQIVQLWIIEQIVQLPLDKLVYVQLAIWPAHFC